MQKLILTLTLLLQFYLCFSQIELVRKSDKQFSIPGNDFAFIEATTDTTKLELVATLKEVTKKNEGIQDAYFAILDQAKKFGANCFKLNSFIRKDSSNTIVLILDTYFGSDSVLNLNFLNHEETAVYIFGDENPNDSKTYSFKMNGEKKIIKSGTYFKHILKDGEEIKINKGGFTGMTMWLTYKQGKKATFLTLTGLGLGGGPVPINVIGASFNTGRLNPVQGDLGCLLKNILKQSD